MEDIRKVKRRLYELDFSNSGLIDGQEILSRNTVSNTNEFNSALRLRDIDNGIFVSPSGYNKGMIYKNTNEGEMYNNPLWLPDIITFSLNIFGLKKGNFYKLTFIGRNTKKFSSINDVTDDRKIIITNNSDELLIDEDLSEIMENTSFSKIFRADSNEIDLYLKIGKIYINNLILDEVDILADDEEETPEGEIEGNKIQRLAYGIFGTENLKLETKQRYIEVTKLSGRGLILFYDKNENEFILERDNKEDILKDSFTNLEYFVDININKFVNNGLFDTLDIIEVNPDVSPNTFKQGYIRFIFKKHGDKIQNIPDLRRLSIIISKIF